MDERLAVSLYYFLFLDGDFNFMWIIITGLLLVYGIGFMKKAIKLKKKGLITGFQLNLGLSVFMLCYSVTRIAFMFSNYYYKYEPENTGPFMLAIRIAYCFGLFSLAFFFYGLEHHFLPTRGVIMSLPLGMGILSIFLPYDLMRFINYVLMIAYIIVACSSYIYIAMKSKGAVRKYAVMALVGLVLFFMGIYLDSRLFKDIFAVWPVRLIPYLVAPICAIVGLSVFYYVSMRG